MIVIGSREQGTPVTFLHISMSWRDFTGVAGIGLDSRGFRVNTRWVGNLPLGMARRGKVLFALWHFEYMSVFYDVMCILEFGTKTSFPIRGKRLFRAIFQMNTNAIASIKIISITSKNITGSKFYVHTRFFSLSFNLLINQSGPESDLLSILLVRSCVSAAENDLLSILEI